MRLRPGESGGSRKKPERQPRSDSPINMFHPEAMGCISAANYRRSFAQKRACRGAIMKANNANMALSAKGDNQLFFPLGHFSLAGSSQEEAIQLFEYFHRSIGDA